MAYSFVSEISNLSEHSPRRVGVFTYLFGFILKKKCLSKCVPFEL